MVKKSDANKISHRIFLLAWVPANAQEKLPVGKIKITDGDTFSLRFKDEKPVKIRLIGIDAPEKAKRKIAKSKN